MKRTKNIKKYSFSFDNFNSFNKEAAGEGLRYLGLEFSELEDDIGDLIKKYFKSLRDNKRAVADIGTMKIIHGSLVRIKGYLDNYYKISKELFSRFKKSIIQHDRKKLKKIFGPDYMEYIEELIPGKGLAEGPKYKALMELVSGEDRYLMEKALSSLFVEPVRYGDKYREFVLYFNDIFSGKEKPVDNYNWVNKYEDLFKFAALPAYFDVRRLFPGKGQEVEFKEEPLDIRLSDIEKRILTEICELWRDYKVKLNSLMPLTERAYLVDKGYVELEKQRNEDLHSIFDRIRALKYMINSFIADGGSEKDFYDKTGLTFNNAYAKLDTWIYILLKVFPPKISDHISKNYIKKLPRTINREETPKIETLFTEEEEDFFNNERVKEYEKGNISGTQEGESEILYRRKPENKLPAGGLSSYRGASEFEKAIKILKESSKKR